MKPAIVIPPRASHSARARRSSPQPRIVTSPAPAPRLRSPSSHEKRPWPIRLRTRSTRRRHHPTTTAWNANGGLSLQSWPAWSRCGHMLPLTFPNLKASRARNIDGGPMPLRGARSSRTSCSPLASKPFGKDVAVKGVASDAIVGKLDETSGMRIGGFVDDIDGQGRSLTTFAREAFLKGIAKGAHAILVDQPRQPRRRRLGHHGACWSRGRDGFRRLLLQAAGVSMTVRARFPPCPPASSARPSRPPSPVFSSTVTR